MPKSPESFTVTDNQLVNIFGQNFREAIREQPVLYGHTDNGQTGNGPRLTYSQQEFSKAVYAFALFRQQNVNSKKRKDDERGAVDLSGPRGIIPKNVFETIHQQPWWTEINEKLKQELPALKKFKDPLYRIIKIYVRETTTAPYRRHSRRVLKF